VSTYSPAPEVEAIARDLIADHHQHLDTALNENVSLTYLFIDPPPKKNGKTVLGMCKKLSSLPAYLSRRLAGEYSTDPLFAIVISLEAWKILEPKQKIALVDHELCHCKIEIDEEGETKLGVEPHDIEEFKAVVLRHGLWLNDLVEFVDAAERSKQANLFEPSEGAERASITFPSGREVEMNDTRQLEREMRQALIR